MHRSQTNCWRAHSHSSLRKLGQTRNSGFEICFSGSFGRIALPRDGGKGFWKKSSSLQICRDGDKTDNDAITTAITNLQFVLFSIWPKEKIGVFSLDAEHFSKSLELVFEKIAKTLNMELGALYVILGTILFSLKSVLAKLVYLEGLDSLQTLSLRFLFALPFYIFILFRSFRNEPREHFQIHTFFKTYKMILLLGFMGYCLASIYDFWGLEYVSAGFGRIVLFSYPSLVVLYAFLLFGQKPTLVEIISLILTYLGIFVSLAGEFKLVGVQSLVGALLIFVSALTYAYYMVGSTKEIRTHGVQKFTAIALTSSCLLVLFLESFRNSPKEFFQYSSKVYLFGMVLGIFSTVLPSILVSEGIQKIGSSRASIIASIGPISTLFFGAWFLEEVIGSEQILGTILVIIGVWIVSKKNKWKPNPT